MTANTEDPEPPVLMRCNASCNSEREPVVLPVGELSEGATRGLELHWVSNACQSRAIFTALNRSFNSETGFAEVGPIYEMQEKQEAQPFLIAEDSLVLGGGSFCLRMPAQGDTVFSFQWVWLFPATRGQGMYPAIQPHLKKRFGTFYAEQPLSSRMESLLPLIDKEILCFSQSGLAMGTCPKCQNITFLSQNPGSGEINGQLAYWHMVCPDI